MVCILYRMFFLAYEKTAAKTSPQIVEGRNRERRWAFWGKLPAKRKTDISLRTDSLGLFLLCS